MLVILLTEMALLFQRLQITQNGKTSPQALGAIMTTTLQSQNFIIGMLLEGYTTQTQTPQIKNLPQRVGTYQVIMSGPL